MLGNRRERGTWLGNGRLSRRLGASLCVFALAIDILLASVQVKCTKLDSSTVNLAVARHADSFFLVKDSSLVAWGSVGSVGRGLHRRGGIS